MATTTGQPPSGAVSAADNTTHDATRGATENATHDAARGATENAAHDPAGGATDDHTAVPPGCETHGAIAAELGALVRRLHQWHQSALPSGPGTTSGPALERPAYALLYTLIESGPARPSTLAEALRVDISTVSRQLGALENAGWIAREADPADRRAQLVDATDSGRAAFEVNRLHKLESLRDMLADWSEPDRTELARLLHQFNEAIGARRRDGWRSPAQDDTRTAQSMETA